MERIMTTAVKTINQAWTGHTEEVTEIVIKSVSETAPAVSLSMETW